MSEHLRTLVSKHRLGCEVRPVQRVDSGEIVAIGWEVELLGVHDTPDAHVDPGCDGCRRVFVALRAIVEAALPSDDERVSYAFRGEQPRVVYDRVYAGTPAVALEVEIVHRDDYARRLDESETHVKDRVIAALRAPFVFIA